MRSYALDHLVGGDETHRENAANALYNLGDVLNKVALGLATYEIAGSEEQAELQLEFQAIAIAMRVLYSLLS